MQQYQDTKYQLMATFDRYIQEQEEFRVGNASRLTIAPTTQTGTVTQTGWIGTTSRLKLPPLEKPNFSGDMVEFPPFLDSWTANFDKNPDLCDVQKLEYFKQSYKGTALEKVKHLPLIGSNYQVTKELIRKTFSKKRKIISQHVNAIIALPAVKTENVTQMRKISNAFTVHLAGLKKPGNRTRRRVTISPSRMETGHHDKAIF
jgi:hypothetical protein